MSIESCTERLPNPHVEGAIEEMIENEKEFRRRKFQKGECAGKVMLFVDLTVKV